MKPISTGEQQSYGSINDLIRDLDLDKKHWINAEALRFVSPAAYERTDVSLRHVPEELVNVELKCSKGHTFKPDWLRKRHPVSVFFKEGKGLLRQCACHVKCPAPGCDTPTLFTMEQPTYRGELSIYGDEAFRESNGKALFVYSFLSFSGIDKLREEFEAEFLEQKRQMAPSVPPESWALHMKELLSGSKRRICQHLAHLDQQGALRGAEQVAALLQRYNQMGALNVYAAVGAYDKSGMTNDARRVCKEDVYGAALMRVIQQTTAYGLAPRFYFERTGDDGWAKQLFDGGRLTLVWAYITRGLPVMSPSFQEPTFSIHLQAADLVSFVVARFLHCLGKSAEGKQVVPEIPPEALGLIRYTLTNGGNWEYEAKVGFPDNFARWLA